MKTYIGYLALALAMALPAASSAQPFPTCEDTRNLGRNTGQLIVGQVYARLDCRADALGPSITALVASTKDLIASFGGPAEYKVCYYEGVYQRIIDRLLYEHEQCQLAGDFPPVMLDTVARFAVATFSAMTRALPASLVNKQSARQVFSRDYGFLETDPDYARCTELVKEQERAILGAGSRMDMYRSALDMLETAICGQAAPPRRSRGNR